MQTQTIELLQKRISNLERAVLNLKKEKISNTDTATKPHSRTDLNSFKKILPVYRLINFIKKKLNRTFGRNK